MDRLTEQGYWETVMSSSGEGRFYRLLSRWLGAKTATMLTSYADFQLWQSIYPDCLPRGEKLKALEVGSAPGHFLVGLHRNREYDVYGLEYTESGAQTNRRVFAEAGLNPEHVVQADFFEPGFQEQYQGYFDLVFSRGFIEHFEDVSSVLDSHLNLLKPGGHLVISIPRLRSLNWLIQSFFDPSNIKLHNIKIMEMERFRELFADKPLTEVVCRYFGTFNLGLFGAPSKSWKAGLLKLTRGLQMVLNGLFFALLGVRGFENRFTSPYLLYIGRKAD